MLISFVVKHLFILFFDFLKRFYWKGNPWTIITTVPFIVYTWFGDHFLRCHILLTNFFTSLRGFTARNFLENHKYRTHHSIHLIRCSFSSLTYSLEAQFYCLFLLYPQRVLLNEHFFENHNYRTSQNIRQRRKWAPDEAYAMTSMVVMIVLKISFQWNPLKK